MKTIPFKIFSNFQAIQNCVNTMVTTKYDDFKQSYHVKRLVDELQARHTDYQKMHVEVMEGAEWNEDKTEPTNKEWINGQLDQLFDETFDLKWAPVPSGVLETINPTPEQFLVFEYLMDAEDVPVQ